MPAADNTIPQAIQAALAHHQAGRLSEAEADYRQILQIAPNQPDALHLLGVIACQVGKYDIAVDLIGKAIETQPSSVMYCNLGNAQKALCRFDAAIDSYRQALRLQPDNVDTLLNLGNAQQSQGQLDAAAESYRQALGLQPGYADALLNLGTVLQAQGKLDAAIDSYRQALAFRPDDAHAHFNLGNALLAQNQPDTAIASFRQALALQPGYVEARLNLGNTLQSQGNLDAAIESYHTILTIKPDYAEAHYNLGTALQEKGLLAESVECFQHALSIKPDYVAAHNTLGNVLKKQDKWDAAIESYRRAILLAPDDAGAHLNLGGAFQAKGELDAAISSYSKALAIKPGYVDAHYNLGLALQTRGDLDMAAQSFRHAIALQSDCTSAYNGLASILLLQGEVFKALQASKISLHIEETSEARSLVAKCISNAYFILDDPEARELVIRAISEPWGRPVDFANAAISLIKLDRNIEECIERAATAWPARLPAKELFGTSGLASIAADRLLQCLLENAPACSIELERFLTAVRFHLLESAIACDAFTPPEEDVLRLHCALAQQCFINEYVYSHTDDEFIKARQLRDKLVNALETGSPVNALWIAAVAAYFPLYSLPSASILQTTSWPESVTGLLTQQVNEPLDEQRYRSGIRRLTAVDDEVSRLVQQQYEENPYPRWVKCVPVGTPVTIDAYLHRQFPFAQFDPTGKGSEIDILIAGCGTGQQSIEEAQFFAPAHVLAVDLSMTSLGYAIRKTREAGLQNIEYAQGDIMKLSTIGRRFDLIESVGVLHHLADPLAGWRELLTLLRPRGFMRLGFYSEYARQDIVAARKFIAERGYGSTAEEIRRCRQDLLTVEDGLKFKRLSSFRDFFGTSECRDLLFHVQEHRFTLFRIKEILDELGLRFIGFFIEPVVLNKYGERFPEDKSKTDLDKWHQFEKENPYTFAGMYQFMVQKQET